MFADHAMDFDGDLAQVIALEHRVWEAWRTGNLNVLTELSAPDYMAIGPEGAFDWNSVRDNFPTSELLSYVFGTMHAQRVSPEVVALTFPVSAKLGRLGVPREVQLHVVSVWVRRAQQWVSVFCSEMPAPEHDAQTNTTRAAP